MQSEISGKNSRNVLSRITRWELASYLFVTANKSTGNFFFFERGWGLRRKI